MVRYFSSQAEFSDNFRLRQQAYQNAAINRMSEYECLDLTGKITWPGGQDELVVAGGFYDIYKGNLEGYNGPVAVKYSVAYDYEVSAKQLVT